MKRAKNTFFTEPKPNYVLRTIVYIGLIFICLLVLWRCHPALANERMEIETLQQYEKAKDREIAKAQWIAEHGMYQKGLTPSEFARLKAQADQIQEDRNALQN